MKTRTKKRLPKVTNSAATVKALQELHAKLTAALLAYMENPPGGIYRASHLSVVASFLRDNRVRVDPAAGRAGLTEGLRSLSSMSLPFTTD